MDNIIQILENIVIKFPIFNTMVVSSSWNQIKYILELLEVFRMCTRICTISIRTVYYESTCKLFRIIYKKYYEYLRVYTFFNKLNLLYGKKQFKTKTKF